MRIGTRRYQPFIMGGSCWNEMATEIDVTDLPRHAVGHGFDVIEVSRPDGSIIYVEPVSGGLVGTVLEEICADMQDTTPEFVEKQQAEMRAVGQKAELVSNAAFWGAFK